MYLGIEIGGTKLQIGIGAGDGVLRQLWKGTVDCSQGAAGIRQQLVTTVPSLPGIHTIQAIGIGFGGPVRDDGRTITSHQIDGWNDYPLREWAEQQWGGPCVVSNDAATAGLAEATIGAGKGTSPVFYITVGSGVGGGLIIDGEIFRGAGRGAAEIGHIHTRQHADGSHTVEMTASGFGIAKRARQSTSEMLLNLCQNQPESLTALHVAQAACNGDAFSSQLLDDALEALAEGISHVIRIVCPRTIVIGGGVSLLGDKQFFEPLRRKVAARPFPPFEGLTRIVPAALGETVVVHGAIELAKAARCSMKT